MVVLAPAPTSTAVVSLLNRLHKGRGGETHKKEQEKEEEEGDQLVGPAPPRLCIGQGAKGGSKGSSSSSSSSTSMRLCANVSTWTGSRRNLQPAWPREEEEEEEECSDEEEEEEEGKVGGIGEEMPSSSFITYPMCPPKPSTVDTNAHQHLQQYYQHQQQQRQQQLLYQQQYQQRQQQ